MGGVKESYSKCESAGDEHMGRVTCGLNQLSTDFAISPPHFEFDHITDLVQVIETKIKIENWLKSKLNDSENTSPETLHLLFMLFARLCYHKNFLMDNIDRENTLHASSFFKDIPKGALARETIRHS